VTFKTGKDELGWADFQVRTWDAACRHTALTALAQLRALAIRNALAGLLTLPGATDNDAPVTADDDSSSSSSSSSSSDADLQIYTQDAPLPARGGQPCPPGTPPIALSVAEATRIARLAGHYAAGLLTRARLAFHLRWSHWRRRHQARARWHHYCTRLPAAAPSPRQPEVTPRNRQPMITASLPAAA